MKALNFSFADLVFDEALIQRFDVNGPRYTSYPTADRFADSFGLPEALHYLKERAENPKRALSLYFHIPFCSTICFNKNNDIRTNKQILWFIKARR